MADNFSFTAGSGSTGAADNIGGVLYPRIKLVHGADGTNDGDVASGNPLPVTGTVTANLGATDNAVLDSIDTNTTTLAGAVDGTEVQADIVSSALPTGAATSAKQDTIIGHIDGIETVLGTIDGDTSALAGAVAGTEVQVDVVASLPAGANAIGKLAANDGVDIGDVTINNAGGVEVVQDTAADLNVTEANSAAIKTAVEVIDNAISGSEMQVDVVASLPAGTNAIGKLAANSGVDIGDVDVTSLPALAAGTNTIGKVAPNEYELAGNTTHVKKYYTSAGAVTDGVVWSPAANKRWYVTDIFINVSAAATVTLEDDLTAGDSPVWKAELAANSGWSHTFTTPLFSGEDEADLLITTSAGNVYVTVTGYEI
jgi:hypothetical protein